MRKQTSIIHKDHVGRSRFRVLANPVRSLYNMSSGDTISVLLMQEGIHTLPNTPSTRKQVPAAGSPQRIAWQENQPVEVIPEWKERAALYARMELEKKKERQSGKNKPQKRTGRY